jgi:hypothetical protein
MASSKKSFRKKVREASRSILREKCREKGYKGCSSKSLTKGELYSLSGRKSPKGVKRKALKKVEKHKKRKSSKKRHSKKRHSKKRHSKKRRHSKRKSHKKEKKPKPDPHTPEGLQAIADKLLKRSKMGKYKGNSSWKVNLKMKAMGAIMDWIKANDGDVPEAPCQVDAIIREYKRKWDSNDAAKVAGYADSDSDVPPYGDLPSLKAREYPEYSDESDQDYV